MRVFSRRKPVGPSPLASGALFSRAASASVAIQGGSAQVGGSAHIGPWTNSFSPEPFAAVVPPDILDLDAWMHRENWKLGRLAGHEPEPGPQALQRLDKLIDDEEIRGHTIQTIIATGVTDKWRVVHVRPDYAEIHLPLPVWREILDHLSIPHSPIQPAASYRGIPVTELAF